MISLAGLPYIDVRTDFNSFLQIGLPAKLEKNYKLLYNSN